MEVLDAVSYSQYPGYSMEWGYATWTENESDEANKDWSIRNRYSNQDGGFNYRGSAEIPWEDFKRMISESIRLNYFEREELAIILKNISDYLLQEQ